MTQLLVIREYIKNFYTKYEEFIVPLLKFVLGLILFLTINGRMGYMEKIDHVAIVLVAALLCSFLPLGVMVFLSAMFLLLHTYALSTDCVVVCLCGRSLMRLRWQRDCSGHRELRLRLQAA